MRVHSTLITIVTLDAFTVSLRTCLCLTGTTFWNMTVFMAYGLQDDKHMKISDMILHCRYTFFKILIATVIFVLLKLILEQCISRLHIVSVGIQETGKLFRTQFLDVTCVVLLWYGNHLHSSLYQQNEHNQI
jgi:hypothetical protein